MGKASRKKITNAQKRKKARNRSKAAAMMGVDMDVSVEGLERAPPTQTLKNPNQRHKFEFKKLRHEIQQMKAERMKLGSRTMDKKAQKKQLTKEIKQLEQEFKERTERETAEYEEKKNAVNKMSDTIERLEKGAKVTKKVTKKKKKKGRYISKYATMTSEEVKAMFPRASPQPTPAAAERAEAENAAMKD